MRKARLKMPFHYLYLLFFIPDVPVSLLAYEFRCHDLAYLLFPSVLSG
jgi:hypothetical protein